jgi:hypothetical protein
MALAKMQALAGYLLNQNLFGAEQFDWWMENGTCDFASKKVGAGLEMCRFRYDAVFNVERYSQSADLFLVLLSVWLLENDCGRHALELPMPDVDVTPLDDSTVDLEVKVTFDEIITVVPDDTGLILYKGNRYSVAPSPITDADKVGVGDNPSRPTDKTYERNED